jgi:IclR family acetate operon transcriptional repressor
MASEVPAVSAAVRILERLARDWPSVVTPAELVRDLNLNRSTCYNIVGTLLHAGWAAGHDGRPGWTLGPRLLALTGVPDRVTFKVAQEEMDELSRRLRFVVFLAQRAAGDGYQVVAAADRATGLRVTVGVGDTFPFSAPALMAGFLAWQEPAEARSVLRGHQITPFTPATVTDVDSLLAELAAARNRGFGISLRQYKGVQSAVSAPIFDVSGQVRLVLCTVAFSSDLDAHNVAEVGAAVRATADRISRRTGGRTGQP